MLRVRGTGTGAWYQCGYPAWPPCVVRVVGHMSHLEFFYRYSPEVALLWALTLVVAHSGVPRAGGGLVRLWFILLWDCFESLLGFGDFGAWRLWWKWWWLLGFHLWEGGGCGEGWFDWVGHIQECGAYEVGEGEAAVFGKGLECCAFFCRYADQDI